MGKCAGYWDWTEECRKQGCPVCSELIFEGRAPEGCTCPTEIAGLFLVAVRAENCSVHGRCQCTTGETRYDDHREQDYWPREWSSKCPLTTHAHGKKP